MINFTYAQFRQIIKYLVFPQQAIRNKLWWVFKYIRDYDMDYYIDFRERMTEKDITNMIDELVDTKSFGYIRYFRDNYLQGNTYKFVKRAVINEDIEMIDFLLKIDKDDLEEFLKVALKFKKDIVIKYLAKKYPVSSFDNEYLSEIITKYKDYLDMFMKHNDYFGGLYLKNAIFLKDKDMIDYIVCKYDIKIDNNLLIYATDNIKFTKRLCKKYNLVPDATVINNICENGNVKDFKWFVNKYGIKPTEDSFFRAILQKKYKIVNMLIDEYGLIPTQYTLERVICCATYSNDINAVRFAVKLGETTKKVLYDSDFNENYTNPVNHCIEKGNITMLEYLCSKFPKLVPTQKTMIEVVKYGRIKMLKYFHIFYGLQYTDLLFYVSCQHNKINIVKFLNRQKLSVQTHSSDSEFSYCYYTVRKFTENREKINYIRLSFEIAVKNKCYETVCFLFENYKNMLTTVDNTLMNYAVKNRDLKVIRFLHSKYRLKCPRRISNIFVKDLDKDTVDYINYIGCIE